ncbi:MAG: FG-GAP repeat domain-containing protein [Gammaproteobacteria bacterium]
MKAAAALVVGVGVVCGHAMAAEQPFEITSLRLTDRVVAAQFADINGNARDDLVVATLGGLPPNETRTLHVYFQTEAGGFPDVPSLQRAVPRASAVFDLADIRPTPGVELLLLRPNAVSVVSLSTDAPVVDLPVPGPSTVAAASDERGFDQMRLVHDDIGGRRRMLIPQIGAATVMELDGTPVQQLGVGGRANYFVSRPESLVAFESPLQLYLDTPRVSIGDINGDGLGDVLAATRHELRLFESTSDGDFTATPTTTLVPNLVTAEDHRRGSGGVVTSGADQNGDGLMDILISHVEGSFADATTTTRLYRNRGGAFDLDAPDDVFVSKDALSSDLLLDINGDGLPELVRIKLKFSVLEVVEIMLTRNVDALVQTHYLGADGRFSKRPASRKKISTGISFDTFRPRGFMPRGLADFNADGRMDFISSGNGKAFEVFLENGSGPFARRTVVQKMPTAGKLRYGDFDRDGRTDWVLFDAQAEEGRITVGRSTSALKLPKKR